MMIVPHECPDVPAMRTTPDIMYNEDRFTDPDFHGDLVIDIDDVIATKLHMAHLNVSQVYEWLPYTNGQTVPDGEAARFAWLCGLDLNRTYTDAEINAMSVGYGVRFARPAARFRAKLIEEYGAERGGKIRFAEAFQICEYGSPMTEELRNVFLSL